MNDIDNSIASNLNYITRIVSKKVEDPDREDVVSEVLLSLCKIGKEDRFAGKSSFKTYLYRIIRNKIADYYRQHPLQLSIIQRILESEAIYTDRYMETDVLIDLLYECIDELPERQRLAVICCELADVTHKELAEKLGQSISSINQLLDRAKCNLGQRMKILLFKKGNMVSIEELSAWVDKFHRAYERLAVKIGQDRPAIIKEANRACDLIHIAMNRI